MVVSFLVVLFALLALVESVSYGVYEVVANDNKSGGLILIFLTFIGFVFALTMYFIY